MLLPHLTLLRLIWLFYKDEVSGNGIKLYSEVQDELDNFNKELEESKELLNEEYGLSSSQKEEIRWLNIAILKRLFPQVFSKIIPKNIKLKKKTRIVLI